MTAEELDHSPMKKGKYGPDRGNSKTPNQVAEIDPGYLVYAYETWTDKPCSNLLYRECQRDVIDNRQQMRVARDQDA